MSSPTPELLASQAGGLLSHTTGAARLAARHAAVHHYYYCQPGERHRFITSDLRAMRKAPASAYFFAQLAAAHILPRLFTGHRG